MIPRCWREFVCRIMGRSCTYEPASKTLRADMKERSSRVDAQAVDMKRQRNVLEQAFLTDQSRKRGER